MRKIFAIILSACFFSLISCEQKQPMNIVCFVDFSRTIDSSTAYWYKATIEKSILRKMGFKDRVTVLPIDFGSQTSSQELFTVNFSKNDYTNEFAGLQSDEVEMKNHQDSVSSAIHIFDQAFYNARKNRLNFDKGSDIFGALKQAQKYTSVNSYNLVIVFSDMLQYTDKEKMNFEDHLNSLSEVDSYLMRADKADLSNTQIVVLTGIQNSIRSEKFIVVKSFWENYLQKCNGQLIDYSSGAVSKLEGLFVQKD